MSMCRGMHALDGWDDTLLCCAVWLWCSFGCHEQLVCCSATLVYYSKMEARLRRVVHCKRNGCGLGWRVGLAAAYEAPQQPLCLLHEGVPAGPAAAFDCCRFPSYAYVNSCHCSCVAKQDCLSLPAVQRQCRCVVSHAPLNKGEPQLRASDRLLLC